LFLSHEWFYSTATHAIVGGTVVVVLVLLLLLLVLVLMVGAHRIGGTRRVGR
jgi:hypothetical protein